MTDFYNYLIPTVHTHLTEGHCKASELLEKIKHHKGEGYHNLFDVELRDDYTGYRGLVQPAMGWFPFDFDSADLELARKNVLKTWGILALHSDYARIFFSGAKGFHLYIRHEFFSFSTVQEYKNFALRLNNTHNVEIDAGIIQANRKFRAPNSLHMKTQCYKVELSYEQLTDWSIDQIKQFSKSPRAFNLTDYSVSDLSTQKTVVAEEVTSPVGPGVFGLENFLVDDIKPKYFLKPCVTKMWETSHGVGERHDVAMALIADSFEAGSSQEETTEKLRVWCSKQGIADRFERDYIRAVSEQFDGRRNYSYGCYNTPKKTHCVGEHCRLYTKLDPSLRSARVSHPSTDSIDTTVTTPVGSEVSGGENKSSSVRARDEKAAVKTEDDPPPSHIAVVIKLVKKYQGQMIKQDKDLFLYTGTHWEEASCQQVDNLKKEIHRELQFVQSDKLEKCFKMFMLYIESVPKGVDLFSPNPDCANFTNGTLWVSRNGSNYELTFKPHSRADYLTSCVSAPYPVQRGHSNLFFTQLLDQLLSGDPEKEQKLLALKQVAGAMLLPKYPQIFFLLGDSGSGKSTFVKTFYYALGGKKYASMVQPCAMKGFELEGMLHKTLNIHTDIDENAPIPDSLLKSLGDRIPFQVNRKGKKVVQASLPAVHVYCANRLPPTKVKNQNVYDRRATIIRLDRVVKGEERVDQFEELILASGVEALIEFAVEGIESLVGSGGFFTKPESSKEMTKSWQEESSDNITDFLDCTKHGETTVSLDPDSEINRTELFTAFSHWATNDQGYKDVPVKAAVFYREVEKRGYKGRRVATGRLIRGFKLGSDRPVTENEAPVTAAMGNIRAKF